MREMRCSSQYPTGPTAAWRHGGASVHYEQTVRERVHRYTMCKQSWNGCIEAYFQNRFFFTNVLDHHKVLEVVICVIASLRKALGRASFIASLRKALGRASFIASSHHCARPWGVRHSLHHCIIAQGPGACVIPSRFHHMCGLQTFEAGFHPWGFNLCGHRRRATICDGS
jgi:hypothetical protein